MTERQESDDIQVAASEASTSETPVQEAGVATPSVPVFPTPSPGVPSPGVFAARPKPHPAVAPAPAAPAARQAVQPVASDAIVVPHGFADAAGFGRATEDGHVFVTVEGEEVEVGQYSGATQDEALNYFVRKFEEIAGQIVLLEQRVHAKAASSEMHKTVAHLREQLAARNAVGDLLAAETRLDTLTGLINAHIEQARTEHQAAREAERAAREQIVTEAEALAGQPPASIQWKQSSARMAELFETWKKAQHDGVRLGRSVEDELWKRFRSARTVFDRHRRAYFSQLDSTNSAAKEVKQKLIAQAEALSSSTDWVATAGEYRHLMDQWKAAPRASKRDDDALWARFRAAQDAFFAARQSANDAIDAEYGQNLRVKEELLVEARALVPVKDLGQAKKAFQSIRDRWEDAGKVPRGDIQRMEAGLRSIEDAIRAAENDHWKRTDPEAKARTNSALSQLEAAIAVLEADLAKAKAGSDARKIAAAQEALDARQAWLEQIRKSADEFGA
ncbi:DUF349 domain-containing protein [Psychromicrobium xiongbiense]|uniref:DUF349 domain-containing protein n=1 Tax=Psychromicrobium xiongbiense TaxID=3051184 RepID=UPI00255580D0|nr:DUF349 domain-containing protein [Psychromicrobium sp. YIM S02556]